ncbi:Fic/DOC family protein [Paracandidimonas soli]|uniref:protein adenylyltransferase n=1 Tax=Paracandidimonas soli TaxID=1917182 RepID=A0A4V2VSM5_9BURK|nr:Fic/DOC family protein [Paracandidimonas soli]TCV02980.1 cell filamentation protein [Paracandidimonas soli]
MKYSDADAYIDPETGVLKNKLGLTTDTSLEEAEASVAFLRALELEQHPIKGNFDLTHLQAIHKKLFGDIYEWAGQIRTVDISKGNTRFANITYIQSEAKRLTDQLRNEQYLEGLSTEQFSQRAAHYLGELNVLHPFRDGNGRTLRVFMGQLAQNAGYEIRWENIERDDMIKASIEAYESSPVFMTKLIKDNLVDLDRE